MTESEMKRLYEKKNLTSYEAIIKRCNCRYAVLMEDFYVMCERDGKYTHPTFCASCSHKEANHDNQSN